MATHLKVKKFSSGREYTAVEELGTWLSKHPENDVIFTNILPNSEGGVRDRIIDTHHSILIFYKEPQTIL